MKDIECAPCKCSKIGDASGSFYCCLTKKRITLMNKCPLSLQGQEKAKIEKIVSEKRG